MADTDLLRRRILVLVGGYGAGKTQVSISLALQAAADRQRVALVDLDIINPYFRSREQRVELGRIGVEVICPPGELAFAENPSLVPEIDLVLADPARRVILDVGGDEAGATVVGRYAPALSSGRAAVLQVVNVFRPFSRTVAEIEELRRTIETKSRCRVDGWINNANLAQAATLADWQEAGRVMRELEQVTGIPIAAQAVNPAWAKRVGLEWEPSWIPVQRYLSLNWKTPPEREPSQERESRQ